MVASPVIIESKTVDIGVKVENIKVEYCGEYCISILYLNRTYFLMLNSSGKGNNQSSRVKNSNRFEIIVHPNNIIKKLFGSVL